MLNEMKKTNVMPVYVVIGANGFVGKNLVHILATCGNVLVRTLERNPSVNKQLPNVTVVLGDLTKLDTLQNLLVPDCIVVNLAYGFNMTSEENLLAAKNLVKICQSGKIRRLIHCSTASVFGQTPDVVVDEDSICNPRTEYGVTKLQIEHILLKASHDHFEFVNLRPTSVFGPGGQAFSKLTTNLTKGSVILNYLRSCFFNKRKLNLVSVETVTAAILFVANTKLKVDGETFIISEDYESINNFHYVEHFFLNKLLGTYYTLPPLDIPLGVLSFILKIRGRDAYNPSRIYDSSKILKMGFRPDKTLQQSLDMFVEWYKTQATDQQSSQA